MGANLTAASVNCFMFKDNALKMFLHEADAFNAYAEGIVNTCNTLIAIEWGVDLPDYSNEYVNAMLGA